MRGVIGGLLLLSLSLGCTDPGLFVVDSGSTEDAGDSLDAGDAGDARLDASSDAAVDRDSSMADAGLDRECSFMIATRPLGDLPGTFDDGCADVTVISSGVSLTPRIKTAAFDDTYQVLAFAVETLGEDAELIISFGGPVRNLYFRFDLLSFRNSPAQDERLQIEVDSSLVTPNLSEFFRTSVSGFDVQSTNPAGAGRIDVASAQTSLVIRLLDLGTRSGLGVEILQLRYDRAP